MVLCVLFGVMIAQDSYRGAIAGCIGHATFTGTATRYVASPDAAVAAIIPPMLPAVILPLFLQLNIRKPTGIEPFSDPAVTPKHPFFCDDPLDSLGTGVPPVQYRVGAAEAFVRGDVALVEGDECNGEGFHRAGSACIKMKTPIYSDRPSRF